MMKNKAVAYVDGRYNKKEDLCGWGVVFLYEDEAPEYFSGSYKGIHWNVTGEINAAVYAVEKALEYGCSAIEIHYDYTGIEPAPYGPYAVCSTVELIIKDFQSFFATFTP